MNHHYNSWLEISQDALLHNLTEFEKFLAPHIRVMPVIKSNAYGHGLVEVAQCLEPKVEYFGVVFVEEALQIREAGVKTPILVFSTMTHNKEAIIRAIQQNITFTIYNEESYEHLEKIAEQIQQPALIHINVDTGMTRLGFNQEQHKKYINKICHSPNIKIQGIYSHFSSADNEFRYTNLQCQRFEEAVQATKEVYQGLEYQHILNTPGAMLGFQVGNIARIGLGIYGLIPSELSLEQARKIKNTFRLKPALEWKTKIIQVREVAEETSVGYGRSYITAHDETLAILPVGYADGYSRALSNCGEVLINGTRCKVRGRICMNNTIVDVSHIPNIQEQDEVVLIGKSKTDAISAEQVAEKIDTAPAEVITAIDTATPRVYV